MSYVSPEDIALAKEMDLLTYLQNYEPQNLKRVARSTYCTREHDSLKISNGKWHWFSRGVGGKTALDYLIKVKDIPFISGFFKLNPLCLFLSAVVSLTVGSSLSPSTMTGGTCHRAGRLPPWRRNLLFYSAFSRNSRLLLPPFLR